MRLFINACVRRASRTEYLARELIQRLGGAWDELRLEELDFPKADEAFLLRRDALLARGEYADPLFAPARQFAAAETIVLAAPYWDLSFPAMLKQYLEQICAVGITFRYTPEGIPEGLCRAKTLYYVETAGGPFAPDEFGFGYVQALCRSYFGINDVRLVKAVGLDVDGADVNGILLEAAENMDTLIHEDYKEGKTSC